MKRVAQNPAFTAWLASGWQAKCSGCGVEWQCHTRPSNARCPKCGDLATMSTSLAAVGMMPAMLETSK